MLKSFAIASLIVVVASSGKIKDSQVKKESVGDSKAQGSQVFEGVSGEEFGGHEVILSNGGDDFNHISSHGGKNYISGAELTSLAHTSALRAKSAVQNQITAGSQAAFGAKSSLAQAALGAAATAQAALVGKQIIVQSLQRELAEAEHQLQSESAQYQKAEEAAHIAQEYAQQAQSQINGLTSVLATVQATAQGAAKAAAAANHVSASQHSMIQEAKQRVSLLGEELQHALAELQETEAAAHKAATAAQIAQANAQAAASDVATSAEKSNLDTHGSLDEHH